MIEKWLSKAYFRVKGERIFISPKRHWSIGWTTRSREEMLNYAFEFVVNNRIHGSYAEFGVWRGDTLATAYHFALHFSRYTPWLTGMQFYAFDSFEGFPEANPAEAHLLESGNRRFSLDQFLDRAASHGIDKRRLDVGSGWFSDVLQLGGEWDEKVPDASLALSYVDADLYESTRDLLPFLKKKMAPGGVVMFDNWYFLGADPTKGEPRAVREFMTDNPGVVLVPFYNIGWHGKSFIFHEFEPDVAADIRANLI